MNVIDSFRFVLKNMFEKKGRVFLTLSGIVIGIFTFTFFIFVSQGLNNAISEQFMSLGVNVLGVQPVGSTGEPGGEGLTDRDVELIKQVVSETKYVAPAIFYRANYEYGRERASTVTLSYPDMYLNDVLEDFGLEVVEGRNIRPGDSGSVVLGNKFAKEGFPDREIKVGNSLKVDDRSFRVIGILEEQGDLFVDNSVFMNFDDIKEISDQETYSVIRVSFVEGADIEFYREQILRKLNPNNDEKRVQITSPQDQIEQFNQILGLLTAIIVFISSVALVVGGINVMNTMYSNVLERINEISVMKALGSRNEDIRNLFLIESSILGFMGALIGFFGSYVFAELLSYLITNFAGYNVPVYFDMWFFLGVMVVTSLFAMFFGTYPALRAAKINPADNLRDE